jgi:hypothetical protein
MRVAASGVRQRNDGSTYTAVLYVLNGKQRSSSFNDHADPVRFQELANKTSPAEALEVWAAQHLGALGEQRFESEATPRSRRRPHPKLPSKGQAGRAAQIDSSHMPPLRIGTGMPLEGIRFGSATRTIRRG